MAGWGVVGVALYLVVVGGVRGGLLNTETEDSVVRRQDEQQRKDVLGAFQRWIDESVGEMSTLMTPGTGPTRMEWKNRFGFTLTASEPINAGSIILQMPASLILDRAKVMQIEPYKTMFAGKDDVVDDITVLTTCVMMEHNKMLFENRPRQRIDNWVNLMLYKSTQESPKDSNTCGWFAHEGWQLEEDVIRGNWELVPHLNQSEKTYAPFKEAMRAVISRSFESDKGIMLVPAFDMLNHHYDANTTLSVYPPELGDFWELRAERSFREGEQIYFNYRHTPNFHLFYRYGFALKNNPDDFLPIPLRDMKDQSGLEKLPRWWDTHPYVIFGPDNRLLDEHLRILLAYCEGTIADESCKAPNKECCVADILMSHLETLFQKFHGECTPKVGKTIPKQSPYVHLERKFFESVIAQLQEDRSIHECD